MGGRAVTENGPDNIVLRYLRNIDAKLDQQGERIDALTGRISALEKQVVIALALCCAAGPAQAQIQPGPNLSPNGFMFTFSPRAGYLGPPAAIFPYAPYAPPRPRVYVQAPPPSPPPAAAAAPPVRYSEPGAIQARPEPKLAPPAGRERPPVPCPNGCPREPDEP
jgi:hypothetical protein